MSPTFTGTADPMTGVWRSRRFVTIVTVLALTLGVSALGVVDGGAPPAAAAVDGYRIVDGQIQVVNNSSAIIGPFVYSGGWDQSGGREDLSSTAIFSVHSPGELVVGGYQQELRAPLRIDKWDFEQTQTLNYSSTPCGYGVKLTTRDSDVQYPFNDPSAYQISVALTPGDPSEDFTVALSAERSGGEPRFGWLPLGLTVSDTSNYPTYRRQSSYSNTIVSGCPSNETRLAMINGPGSYALTGPDDSTGVRKSITGPPPTYSEPRCDGSGPCRVRVEGESTTTYSGPVQGSTVTTWWVDVELPAAGTDCISTTKKKTVAFKARQTKRLSRDFQLGTFKVKTRWCKDVDGRWQITSAKPSGKVENGRLGLAGIFRSFFGFQLHYNEDREEVEPAPPSTSVVASGSFSMCFDIIRLLDKFQARKGLLKVFEKALQGNLGVVFRAYKVKTLNADMIKKAQRAVDSASGKSRKAYDKAAKKIKGAIEEIDETLRRLTGKKGHDDDIPDRVEDVIENMIPDLWDEWDRQVGETLASSVGLDSQGLARKIVKSLDDVINRVTRYCDAGVTVGGTTYRPLELWAPEVTVFVKKNGALGYSIGGAKSPTINKIDDITKGAGKKK